MSYQPFSSTGATSTNSGSEERFRFHTDEGDDDDLLTDDVGDCTSFRQIGFESEEMKHLLKLESPPTKDKVVRPDYHAEHLFPQWILNNQEWQSTECRGKGNKISEILQTSHALRSQEQTSSLIHWLMSVWKTAYTMGYKRCGQMTKVFQFLVFEPGQDIIVEKEKGLTFYIIISGEAVVLKAGIGQVAILGKGHSFGELALTEGNDRRSATIRAETRVEILQLHKVDYDHFVKDIQLVERRENLHVLRSCKLFENWPRTKVQKLCNFCSRMTFKPDENFYCQGDKPDKIYFIIEGQVDIYKEVYVVVRNRWPTGMKTWEGMARKKVKPFLSKSLHKDDFFGELVQDEKRNETATAKTRCTVLTLDRLEFTHVISGGKTLEELQSGEAESLNDKKILDSMLKQLSIKGGPSTTAQLNDYVKAINVKTPKKKRTSTIDLLSAMASTMSSVDGTDDGTVKTSDHHHTHHKHSMHSHSHSHNQPPPFSSPIKTHKPHASPAGRSRARTTSDADTETSNLNDLSLLQSEHSADEKDDEGADSSSSNTNTNTECFAHGLHIEKNTSTEFSFGNNTSPTAAAPAAAAKSAKEKAKDKKLRHIHSAVIFERQLSRASSAVGELVADREVPLMKKSSFHELIDSVSSGKKAHELPVESNRHRQAHAHVDFQHPPHTDGHLKLMVDELVTVNKKLKYYDELAEIRFARHDIATKRAKKINAINGHSLKFSGSTMKNYFQEPTKTVFAPNRNLKGSRSNPKINIKVTDEINPVMTSIDSVVLHSDKGRKIRSYSSQDINSYIDATQSKTCLPSCSASLVNSKSKLKLFDDLSTYKERDVFVSEREHNPQRDYARQASRLQGKDVQTRSLQFSGAGMGDDDDDDDDDLFFS